LVHTQKSEMNNFYISIPNTNEQQAIATALSDTNDLIFSLEKLINKKKLIKQGAIQELLTGEKRLEGFSGEWQIINLGKICEIKDGVLAEFLAIYSKCDFFEKANRNKFIAICNS